MAVVTVEEVHGRAAFKRFLELPYFVHRGEPRWSPPLIAYERWRLDPHRNPFFDEGDGVYLLARRQGQAAGRITAHVVDSEAADGWFGFYDAVDDGDVVRALVEHAATWLRDRGCSTMTGPASFTVDADAGILVEGFETPGTTGRPWQPQWYAEHLGDAGLAPVDGSARRTWRLETTDEGPVPAPAGDVDAPAMIGRYADARLLLRDGGGWIAAVPDLTAVAGSAVQLARRARHHDWDGCTVVAADGDLSVLVPLVQRAAGAAGYEWLVAPWHPDPDAPPATVHELFHTAL